MQWRSHSPRTARAQREHASNAAPHRNSAQNKEKSGTETHREGHLEVHELARAVPIQERCLKHKNAVILRLETYHGSCGCCGCCVAGAEAGAAAAEGATLLLSDGIVLTFKKWKVFGSGADAVMLIACTMNDEANDFCRRRRQHL